MNPDGKYSIVFLLYNASTETVNTKVRAFNFNVAADLQVGYLISNGSTPKKSFRFKVSDPMYG